MTPQQLKVMKLALEALKWCHGGEPCGTSEAITAIKEALAEHAMREVQRLGQEIEQEPVAWPCLIAEADFSQDTVTLTMQCQDYKVSAGKHWLSTTPPQRKPLTDEEIDKLLGPFPRYADEWSMTDFIRFARAIEAAHGIKENT